MSAALASALAELGLTPDNAPTVFERVLATKYFSATGLVILIYDHLLSLPAEVRLIWPLAWEYPKIAFIYNRYAVTGYLLYVAYMLSGISDNLSNSVAFPQASSPCIRTHFPPKRCKGYVIFISLAAFISMAIANMLMLFRVYTLYDHRRNVIFLMGGGFAVSYVVIMIFGVLAIRDLFSDITPEPILLRTCIIPSKPLALIGVWASMVAFDVYVFALTLWNAAERPRPIRVELVQTLKRDGIAFFLILFCLRLLNLIISIFAGPDLIFLGVYFVQAMVSLTLSRLLLQVENMRRRVYSTSIQLGTASNTTEFEMCSYFPEMHS